MNHGAHFMAAIAYVWNERKQVKTPSRNKVWTTPEVTTYVCTRGLQKQMHWSILGNSHS